MAIIVTVIGALGKDAEHKTTGNSELCKFPVAGSVGYGDKKQTLWFDVTKWGKGSEGLSRILKKGTKVTVVGELSTREHEGKTYLQCRADYVELQGEGGNRGGGNESPRQNAAEQGGLPDDLHDVPFGANDFALEWRVR